MQAADSQGTTVILISDNKGAMWNKWKPVESRSNLIQRWLQDSRDLQSLQEVLAARSQQTQHEEC